MHNGQLVQLFSDYNDCFNVFILKLMTSWWWRVKTLISFVEINSIHIVCPVLPVSLYCPFVLLLCSLTFFLSLLGICIRVQTMDVCLVIKMQISNLGRTTCFWNNLHNWSTKTRENCCLRFCILQSEYIVFTWSCLQEVLCNIYFFCACLHIVVSNTLRCIFFVFVLCSGEVVISQCIL